MRLLDDAIQAISCVFAAALSKGVISDDLRNRGLSNMWGNGRCGCNTACMWMVLSSMKQGSRAACTELDVPSTRYKAPQIP